MNEVVLGTDEQHTFQTEMQEVVEDENEVVLGTDEQHTFQTEMQEVVEDENEVVLGTDEQHTFHAEMQEVIIGTDDHTKLKNLDAPDQHPISAIAKLSTELSKKMGVQDAMTNMDIMNIINS